MQILILAQVKECRKDDSEFYYSGKHYKFRSRKIAKACEDFPSHIDCIDNAYTGDPKPYYARIYFGYYDPICFDYSDDYIEYDTQILFAKKGAKVDDIDSDTRIVSQETDMYELKEAYEWHNLESLWLDLYKYLGSKIMRNAGVTTTGNHLYLNKQEVLEGKRDSEVALKNMGIY